MNFVPTAVAIKSRLVPVNAAKQSAPRAAASISTVRHVNTAASKPRVNVASPTKYSYFKAHSPLRRPFNQKSAAKTNNFNEKVYTAEVNNITIAGPEVVVSTAKGKRENVVKSLACWIWRPTRKVIDHISKDSGSYMPKRFNYVDPQGRLNSATITNSINRLNTVSVAGQSFDNNDLPTDPLMLDLEDSIGIFRGAYDDEDVGAEADLSNLETTMNVSPIPTPRIHKDHPKDHIIKDINSAI
ncbi:hypothetical protein Tco_1372054 [Tanacetum coccineum]